MRMNFQGETPMFSSSGISVTIREVEHGEYDVVTPTFSKDRKFPPRVPSVLRAVRDYGLTKGTLSLLQGYEHH